MKRFRYNGSMLGSRKVAVPVPENLMRVDVFTAGKYNHSIFYWVEEA